MNITIYSKSGCAQCVFTKKFLESQGVAFQEKRVDETPEFLEEVLKMGYRPLPVVTSDQEKSFSGYNPIQLKDLVSKWQK